MHQTASVHQVIRTGVLAVTSDPVERVRHGAGVCEASAIAEISKALADETRAYFICAE
jgi:hypothetical protein